MNEKQIWKINSYFGCCCYARFHLYVSYIFRIQNNWAENKGSPVQPLCAAINCTLWVVYGLFKKARDWPIAIANAPGVVLGIITCVTSLWTPRKIYPGFIPFAATYHLQYHEAFNWLGRPVTSMPWAVPLIFQALPHRYAWLRFFIYSTVNNSACLLHAQPYAKTLRLFRPGSQFPRRVDYRHLIPRRILWLLEWNVIERRPDPYHALFRHW